GEAALSGESRWERRPCTTQRHRGRRRMATRTMTIDRPSMAPRPDTIVRCRGVKKALGGKRVLNGIDCDLPEGWISASMGPAGAGKSVLLRHLVGLLTPDGGEVIVDGRQVPRLEG